MATIFKFQEKFDEEKVYKEKVFETPNYLIIHFHLKANQKIPLHKSPSEVIVTVLKGKGKFFIGNYDNITELNIGDVLKYDREELHGFEAIEDMVVQALITPNPIERLKL